MDYTPSQQAAAAYAAGALHSCAAILRQHGLDNHASRLADQAKQLVTISGVQITPEALAALSKLLVRPDGSLS